MNTPRSILADAGKEVARLKSEIREGEEKLRMMTCEHEMRAIKRYIEECRKDLKSTMLYINHAKDELKK